MSSEHELERWLVSKIIREVHNGSVRLSDSAQRELHFALRERLAKLREVEFERGKAEPLIQEFAASVHENALEPSVVTHKKVIVRKNLLSRLLGSLGYIWPFGR